MELEETVSSKQKKKEIDEFFKDVAAEYLTDDFMKGRKRPKPQIRFAYAKILSEVFADYPLSYIGSILGRDHSWVLYAKKQVEYAVYMVEEKNTTDIVSNLQYNIYISARVRFEHYIFDARDALHTRESYIGICNKISHYQKMKEAYLLENGFSVNQGGKSNNETKIYLYDRYGNLIFTFASVKQAAELLNVTLHYITSYLDKDLYSYNHGYLRSEKQNNKQ